MNAAPPAPPRIDDVDALRGFALFGILVVNIGAFASAYYGTGVAPPAFAGPVDHAVRWLVSLLFETKFYLLFSFLFGYSFTLQLDAAARAGAAFVPRFLRRLSGLAVLGIGHGVLLYHGDILTTYALLGLALLLLRRLTPAMALRRGIQLIALSTAAWALLALLAWLGGEQVDIAAIHTQAQQAEAAYRGNVATTIAQHWHELSTQVWFVLLFLQAPSALGLFLFGLAAGRLRLLENIGARRTQLHSIIVIGLPLGTIGAVIYTDASLNHTDTGYGLLGLAIGLLSAPLLTAAYAALALLGFHTRTGERVARALAPTGRMALSNYLLQSLICAFIFTGYGLRLHGQLAPLPVLGIALAIFAAQMVMSAWWLRRFAYGPLEWLLRALTNAAWPRGRAAALRKAAPCRD